MNSLISFFMERIIMVALSYRAYFVFISFFLFCRAFFFVAGSLFFCKVKEDFYYGEYKFWKLYVIIIDFLVNLVFELFCIEL